MRTPVAEYNNAGMDLDFEPFDKDRVRAIIADTFRDPDWPDLSDEKIDEIADQLNAASQLHEYTSGTDKAPTDSKINETLKQIARLPGN